MGGRSDVVTRPSWHHYWGAHEGWVPAQSASLEVKGHSGLKNEGNGLPDCPGRDRKTFVLLLESQETVLQGM